MKSDFSPSRRAWNVIMTALVWAAAVLVIALTVGVIGLVLVRGIPRISWEFLSTTASVLKGTDGILPAILNTLYVILLTLLIVLPLGVGAAVYLTEYASNRKLIEVIEFTNETLAGIPSIIYGLVGMLVFAQTMGFKTCLLSGSLTLVVMNLPTIIRTTQESLKTVPQGYREGALGLGAGKWHIIRTIVLPCSIDGIVTGCILAVGRIVGESAALLFTAGAAEVIAKSVFKAYTSNGATLSVLLYLRAFEDGDFASAWGIGAVLLVLARRHAMGYGRGSCNARVLAVFGSIYRLLVRRGLPPDTPSDAPEFAAFLQSCVPALEPQDAEALLALAQAAQFGAGTMTEQDTDKMRKLYQVIKHTGKRKQSQKSVEKQSQE